MTLRFVLCLACALGGWATVGTPRVAAEEVVLENTAMRLAIRDGRLVSLFDKARSLEHVASGADSAHGLFCIQFVHGVEPAGELDAAQMAARVTQHVGASAEIAYEHARASVRVHVVLADDRGESRWSIAVEPKDATDAVAQVTFPVVVTPRAETGNEKRYLFPMFEGRFAPLSQPPYWRPYPAHVFAQMIACVASSGGFVLWTDDSLGHVKAFGFTNMPLAAAFGVRHQMPYTAGQAWQSPYGTRVTFCDSTWQGAADVYREWATKQSWSNTPLRDREDIPDLLRHPPLCISTQLGRENLEDLPDRLAAWGKRIGAPIVYRPLGWEKHGNWVGIDYFPPSIGQDDFRTLMTRLKERGIVVSGFISGYRWTTHVRGASPATNLALEQFFQKNHGESVCERTRDGELLTFLAEGRDSYRICRGTPLGRHFLEQTASHLFDLGVTAIHDDQDHGPYPDGLESCFDPTHGHPLPCGPWSTTATRESLREIRAEASRRGLHDFFLTKESCSELLNMDLHAYQARLFNESTTPGLVPLVQYLYHEQIPMIFGWVTANSASTRELAAMLVYGQAPCLAFWGTAASRPEAMPAAGQTLLDDYFAAMDHHARPFLLYGRMTHPLIVDAPVVSKTIRQIKDRPLPRPREIDIPLVIQSAWDDGQGNVGVFAVNMQAEESVVRVRAPGTGSWQATTYLGGHAVEQSDLGDGEELSWSLVPGRLGSIVLTRSGPTSDTVSHP